mgnify:CR=1 FL=1
MAGVSSNKSVVLITGGAGYIGSHSNKLFSNEGYETVVFDNLSNGHRELAAYGTFFSGDLTSPEDIQRCLRTYSVESVIHFAGFAYVGESVEKPALYYRNNIVSTLNLLDCMRECGVHNIVFSSTCSTYGIPQEVPITEDHPQHPINPYGRSKLTVEHILKDYEQAYGIQHVILRYFNVAGADPDGEMGEWHVPETHLIPLVIEAAKGTRPGIDIYGTDYDTPDGTCIRDYIHVADLSNAHVRAMEYMLDSGKSDCFNLGNGNGFSVREVVGAVEDVTGVRVRTRDVQRRPGDPPVLISSAEKAEQTLDWRKKYPDLETIIEHAWVWHRNRR